MSVPVVSSLISPLKCMFPFRSAMCPLLIEARRSPRLSLATQIYRPQIHSVLAALHISPIQVVAVGHGHIRSPFSPHALRPTVPVPVGLLAVSED